MIYHSFLIWTGQTTNENLKGAFVGMPGSPYSLLSGRRNCLLIFCKKIRKSYLTKELVLNRMMNIQPIIPETLKDLSVLKESEVKL
jgi:hypothetical protein